MGRDENEDIREICRRVILAEEPEQFKGALTELKIAIRDHIADAENKGIHMLLKKPNIGNKGEK